MKHKILVYLFFMNLFLVGSEIKKEYYPSGKLKSEIFVNGLDGWIKKYYDSGKLMGFIPIKNGKFHGESTIYFNSGEKAFVNNFENGIGNGTQLNYYLSGKIRSNYTVKNGQYFGEGKEFFESGKIAAIWKYNGEKIKGKTYYESGEIYSICEYNDIALIYLKAFDKNGTPLNGFKLISFNSGKLQTQSSFFQGVPNKLYKSYYESGSMSYKGFFENGKPEGEHKIFSENGKTSYLIPYNKGKIDGIVYVYSPTTGELMEKISYKMGKKIEAKNVK